MSSPPNASSSTAGTASAARTDDEARRIGWNRLGWNRLGGYLIICGAFGLFRRDPTIAARGSRHDTVGEDMELVVRMRGRAHERGEPERIVFVPDPVAWTEVPRRLRMVDRWHRGLARHRRGHGDWGRMERAGFRPVSEQ